MLKTEMGIRLCTRGTEKLLADEKAMWCPDSLRPSIAVAVAQFVAQGRRSSTISIPAHNSHRLLSGEVPHLVLSLSYSETFSHSSSVLALDLLPCDCCDCCDARGFTSPAPGSCTSTSLLAAAGAGCALVLLLVRTVSTSVSLSDDVCAAAVLRAALAFSATSRSWFSCSSRANQLMAYQRPPLRKDRMMKWML